MVGPHAKYLRECDMVLNSDTVITEVSSNSVPGRQFSNGPEIFLC